MMIKNVDNFNEYEVEQRNNEINSKYDFVGFREQMHNRQKE